MKHSKSLVLMAVFALASRCPGANDEAAGRHAAANEVWTTLALDDGQIVEVAVDFKIEKMDVGPDGEAKMILKAKAGREEIGFSAELSQFQLSETAVLDPGKFEKVAVSTITIRSIGAPTMALERRVQDELRGSRTAKLFKLTGIYLAYSYSPIARLDAPSIFNARAQGVTFDDNGKRLQEPTDYFYDIEFLIDAPKKRLTVYFSERAGYGGSSNAAFARKQWLQSITIPKSEPSGTSRASKADASPASSSSR